jgi:hypothetical protein
LAPIRRRRLTRLAALHIPPLSVDAQLDTVEELLEPMGCEGMDWHDTFCGQSPGQPLEVGQIPMTRHVMLNQWDLVLLQELKQSIRAWLLEISRPLGPYGGRASEAVCLLDFWNHRRPECQNQLFSSRSQLLWKDASGFNRVSSSKLACLLYLYALPERHVNEDLLEPELGDVL